MVGIRGFLSFRALLLPLFGWPSRASIWLHNKAKEKKFKYCEVSFHTFSSKAVNPSKRFYLSMAILGILYDSLFLITEGTRRLCKYGVLPEAQRLRAWSVLNPFMFLTLLCL